MTCLVPCLAGLLFGTGLLISGMADPTKVQGFLDISGNWDPSLAFTMFGALVVSWPAFRFVERRGSGAGGCVLHLPMRRNVDFPLVAGSIIFGAGWGLAGICPGPAFVLAGYGFTGAFWFVLAMVVGMAVFEVASRILSSP